MKPGLIRGILIAAGLGAVILVVAIFPAWRKAVQRGGQEAAEPFHVAGNLWFVGASDVAAFLLTDPAGHILIDAGYPGTPPLIQASIAKLGFDIRDVKIILSSEPHGDHAGGLAELQRASGAAVWVSRPAAPIVERGGDGDPTWGEARFPRRFSSEEIFPALHAVTERAGVDRYPAPRIDHEFDDGDTVRLGATTVTAHLTGGHVPGCTTWTFPVRDGQRTLRVVMACGLELLSFVSVAPPETYPGLAAEWERTFRVLRDLPVDIFLTTHGRAFGRYRKFAARGTTADSVAPFIDPEGYREYVDNAERQFREQVAAQKAARAGRPR